MPIRWQCPTAVRTRLYSTRSDVYSFGVVLWEIYADGARPFGSLAASEVVAAVLAGERLHRPSASTPEDVLELIRECTQLAPAARPSMAAVGARLRGPAWAGEEMAQGVEGAATTPHHQANPGFVGLALGEGEGAGEGEGDETVL